jgi:ABC-type oligopeptide transport system substrate-binding subunit
MCQFSSSRSNAAGQQSTASNAARSDGDEAGAPADALSIKADEARMLMNEVPVAPQPIFTRKLSKDELQKIRENIPMQREPMYEPVSALDR